MNSKHKSPRRSMHRYEHRSVTQLCVARSLMYDKLVNVSKIKECISDKSHNIGVIRIEQLCTFWLIFSNKSTRHLHFSKFHCNFYVSFFFQQIVIPVIDSIAARFIFYIKIMKAQFCCSMTTYGPNKYVIPKCLTNIFF